MGKVKKLKPINKEEYPVEEIKPKGQVGLKELTPLQAVGYRLAAAILIIVGSLLVLSMIDILSLAATMQDLDTFNTEWKISDLEARTQLAKTMNALVLERVSKVFDFVATSIFPLLSALIGFLFGARTTQDGS